MFMETQPHSDEGKSLHSRGAWNKFAEMNGWQSPVDALHQSLGLIRNAPIFLQMAGELLPEDHQRGDPLPIDLELKALLFTGTVGRDPRSLVTIDEFLAAAPSVWNMTSEQIRGLKEQMLPEAEMWLSVQREKQVERYETEKEGENRFLLLSWDSQRFQVLTEQVLPQSDMQSIQQLLRAFTKFQREALRQAFDSARNALEIGDTSTRRAEISRNEQAKGYLFLDSIADQLPTLDRTYEAGRIYHDTLQKEGTYFSDDSQQIQLLAERERAISQLLYGAKTQHSVQGIESFLHGGGHQIGSTREPRNEE